MLFVPFPTSTEISPQFAEPAFILLKHRRSQRKAERTNISTTDKALTKESLEAEKEALHKTKEEKSSLLVTLPTPGFSLIEVRGQLWSSDRTVMLCHG